MQRNLAAFAVINNAQKTDHPVDLHRLNRDFSKSAILAFVDVSCLQTRCLGNKIDIVNMISQCRSTAFR